MNGPRWASVDEQRLREKWESGATLTMIGRTMGVSRNAVAGKARRLGLPNRPAPRSLVHAMARKARPVKTPQGVFASVNQAAKAHGLPYSTAWYRVQCAVNGWSYANVA